MIAFSKTAEEWGWLGNMSAHHLRREGRVWRTAEALFQALRFADEEVREAIRAKASPMAAKFVAKAHKEQMVVEPCSPQDVENMRLVLRLKLAQHPELRRRLSASGNAVIVEDCSRRRASPWGARLVGWPLGGAESAGPALGGVARGVAPRGRSPDSRRAGVSRGVIPGRSLLERPGVPFPCPTHLRR
jgi:predicted NAD-dependent protein-ADP-ribosyltransferase YbiA (DUF1768 family)